MPIVVVHQPQRVVHELAGEAVGIRRRAAARLRGHGTEGGVVVVADRIVVRRDTDHVRHVLVAVMRQERRRLSVLAEAEGLSRHGSKRVRPR